MSMKRLGVWGAKWSAGDVYMFRTAVVAQLKIERSAVTFTIIGCKKTVSTNTNIATNTASVSSLASIDKNNFYTYNFIN